MNDEKKAETLAKLCGENVVYQMYDGVWQDAGDGSPWDPLSDMQDAMDVIDAMEMEGYEWAMSRCPDGKYCASFTKTTKTGCDSWGAIVDFDELPRAVSEAALKTIGDDDEN